MKIGGIFECQREGPDILVCRQFLRELNPAVILDPVALSNKRLLIQNCGVATETLLKTNKHVVICWDLIPRWKENGKTYKLEDEIAKLTAALNEADVDLDRVSLVCMVQELEAWFLADYQAFGAVIAKLKAPHPVSKIKKFKRPDRESNPKDILEKIFYANLGYIYRDHTHALPIAKEVGNDWRRLRNSPSFCRFAEKAAHINLE